MRALITGASGFAGGWLVRACAQAGDEVIGASRSGTTPDGIGTGAVADLADGAAFNRLLSETEPDVIYHLAALSHVGRSWDAPAETLEQNVQSSVNVLEGIRLVAPEVRVVWASTCEVYGPTAQLPVTEDTPMRPMNPYAVSKASGDMLAGVYANAHGLNLVRARPFNHAGPGQGPTFLISSLAKQAAEARVAGAERLEIVTGNPHTRRDFTDVRDVVRAYRLLAAPDVTPDAYNICTGVSISAADNIKTITELIAPIEIRHTVDPARVRPHEVMDYRGDFSRLHEATGWSPELSMRQTVSDTIAWWESELATARPNR